MEQILPTNEVTEVEGQTYINPQTGIDETNTFIDKLRATQGQQNQEIATDTQRLGTDIPSIQGGLLGSDSYFTSRYQTPMTNANIANLRATAQAQALNDVLANEQAIWKEKYRQAYRNYQKRARAKAKGGGGGGNTTPPTTSGGGNVIKEDESYTIQGAVPGISGGYTVPNIDFSTGEVLGYDYVPYGKDGKVNYNYRYGGGATSSGGSSSKSSTLPKSSSTIFSGDKNRYLGTGGRL